MRVETKYVSPQMAEEFLSTNPTNRNVSHSRVLSYANAMRSGKWKVTNQGLGFSKSGKLMDGQHRLYAIIESGTTIPMQITYDLDEDVFDVIDTGRARTGGDIAGMVGVSSPSLCVAAASVLWRAWHGLQVNEVCPPHIALKVLERYPEIERWAHHINASQKVLPVGTFLASLVYLDAIAGKPGTAERWHKGILKGVDLEAGSPILALRNRCLNMRAEGRILNSTVLWNPVVRVLSAIESGDTLQRLNIETSGGAAKKTALWAEHVRNLPKSRSLDDLYAPERSGGHTREKFTEFVHETRAAAQDKLAKKAEATGKIGAAQPKGHAVQAPA